MTRFRRWVSSAALVTAGLVVSGCGSTPTYNTPPTALGDAGLQSLAPDSRVVVIGQFHNPKQSPISWSDIGSGMSEALTQAMLNEGRFDVWTNPRLSHAVEKVLVGPTDERERLLGELYKRYPKIRFVVIGRVTDFHYAGELPSDIRRWTLFGGKRDAIAALQFWMVDLETRRVLVADHVYGTGRAGRWSKSREVYKDIAFGSYLFWNSPLGRATEEAIEEAMARIGEVVPTTVEALRVVKLLAPRKVELKGTSLPELKKGQQFYVYCLDANGRMAVVRDSHTAEPIRARILQNSRDATTAWLMGEIPEGLNLLGAELRWNLPAPVAATAVSG